MAETRHLQRTRKLTKAVSVPDFQTESEAAHWYDTHDTSGLASTLVTQPEDSKPPSLETIAVRISRREVDELKRRAAHLGIGYTTYVRMLITRHVLQEHPIQ